MRAGSFIAILWYENSFESFHLNRCSISLQNNLVTDDLRNRHRQISMQLLFVVLNKTPNENSTGFLTTGKYMKAARSIQYKLCHFYSISQKPLSNSCLVGQDNGSCFNGNQISVSRCYLGLSQTPQAETLNILPTFQPLSSTFVQTRSSSPL